MAIQDKRHRTAVENRTYQDQMIPSQEMKYENKERLELLMRNMNRLTERQRRIIKMKYGIENNKPMTLKAIGDHFEISIERVRQIYARGMSRLEFYANTSTGAGRDALKARRGLSPSRPDRSFFGGEG